MIRKLIKYEMKANLKFWLILVATILFFTILGILSTNLAIESTFLLDEISDFILDSKYYSFWFLFISTIITISSLVLFLCCIAVFMAVFAMLIILMLRFYRSMYTDQGYLTLTLPVKRSTVYYAKTLSNSLLYLTISLISGVGVIMILTCNRTGFTTIVELLNELFDYINFWLLPINFLSIVIGLFDLLLMLNFTITLLQFCITLGSTIVKKNKLLASIGVYYGCNFIISIARDPFAGTLFPRLILSIMGSEILSSITIFLSTISLGLFFVIIEVFLHFINVHFLEKHLNLA